MSDQKSKLGSALSGLIGLLGLSVVAGVLVTAMVTPAIAVTSLTAQSSVGLFNNLPDYLQLSAQSQKNTIYATNNAGEPVKIAQVFRDNREEIAWDQVNENVKLALLAAEDRKFYEHGGVNITSIIRAALANVAASDIESGASTITMQLVKNILINDALQEKDEAIRAKKRQEASEQTIDRKLREMKLAIGLEKRYTKNEIMLGYLNIAGFGGSTYGIQAAAQQFFSVNAEDLTLPQAASLIAIVQTPSYNSLNKEDNYERNLHRRDVILKRLVSWELISEAEFREAINTPLEVELSTPAGGCRYATIGGFFCDYVTEGLVPELDALGATTEERQANWTKGGYEIYTTLNVDQQRNAEKTLLDQAPAGETRFQLGAAASAVQPGTGHILAMAQNKIYDPVTDDNNATTSVNYNTDKPYGGSSGFQAGSTYKIFTLAEWLKENHGLYEAVDGRVRTYDQSTFRASCTSYQGKYRVPNYGGAGGSISTSAINATQRSINSAYVAMAHKLDQCAIRDTALSMGVHRADGNELVTFPSAILGTNEIAPLALASAFATVASGGMYCKPLAVERIVAADGEELPGQTPDCTRALSPEVAAGVAFALRTVMTGGGTGAAANPNDRVKVIGKTGTSDGAWHTWMGGASTEAALAVWVGNVVGKQNLARIWLPSGIANGARYRIFKSIMSGLNGQYGGGDFAQPPSNLLYGQRITVPNVTGQTAAQVSALLGGLGFVPVNGGEVTSNAAMAGKVMSTSPGAGARISQGSVVTFYIGDGTLTKSMLNVTGVLRDQAKDDLTAAGYTGAISFSYEETTDPLKECTVKSSTPAPGTAVTPATPITLVIHKMTGDPDPGPGSCP